MAQPTRPVAELVDFSGGLNSAEPPDQIGTNQLVEIRNLEYRRTRGLIRRWGSIARFTIGAVFGAGSTIISLFRHTPGNSESNMELWAASNADEVGRVAAGTTWATVALPDPMVAGQGWFFNGVSFNGKLFLPYDSAVDRLHYWDGTAVKRVGIAQMGALALANQGAGTYPAILRYYKAQWIGINPPHQTVYGVMSAVASITPSGAGLAMRVARGPGIVGESFTHWVLWGSADGVNFYQLTTQLSATTFYDDTTVPALYSTLVPTAAGQPNGADYYTPPRSVRFVLVDGAQLLLAGSWETIALTSTVWYTPALNTTGFDVADDERVPSTNRIEIEPQLGGGITGLGGPIGGTPVVFKLDRTYLLNPTSDPTRPYTRQLLSDCVGCISHRGIVLAEDENGNPALYWPARRGYYRYGAGGVEYCSADIENLWGAVLVSDVPIIAATYHRDAGQIWIHAALAAGGFTRFKYHVMRGRRTSEGVRGGWTVDDGAGADAVAACMFSSAPGATMGLRLKPYIGKNLGGGAVYQADADGINRDDNDATTYLASLITRAVDHGIGEQFGVQNVYVQGIADTAPVTLNVSVRRNFDSADSVPAVPITLATQRGTVSASGLEISECEHVQVRVADQAALNQHWALDRLGVRVRAEAPKE